MTGHSKAADLSSGNCHSAVATASGGRERTGRSLAAAGRNDTLMVQLNREPEDE